MHLLTTTDTLIGVVLGAISGWIIGSIQGQMLLRQLRDLLSDIRSISLKEELYLTRILAQKIKAGNFTPDLIVAVTPGGLMIAEWLSRKEFGEEQKPIPVRTIYVQQIRKKTGEKVQVATVNSDLSDGIRRGFSKASKVLLIVDVCRGGGTLAASLQHLTEFFHSDNIRTASLIRQKDSAIRPAYVGEETSKVVRFEWK